MIALHNKEHDTRLSDRMKAVIYSRRGYKNSDIAELIFKSIDTVRRYLKEFEETGKFEIHYKGKEHILTDEESEQLSLYVSKNMISDKKQIMDYIQKNI